MSDSFAFKLRDCVYDHRPTKSLTQILKDYNVELSTKRANDILMEKGILEDRAYPTSRGGVKKFPALTKIGLIFGENAASYNKPLRLVPRFYTDMEEEIVKIITGKGGLM